MNWAVEPASFPASLEYVGANPLALLEVGARVARRELEKYESDGGDQEDDDRGLNEAPSKKSPHVIRELPGLAQWSYRAARATSTGPWPTVLSV